jgi:hypothetical protein
MKSWSDWLGNGRRRDWRPFKDARAFAHSLKLKNQHQWFDYAKLGTKPHDIPANPNSVYADAGWTGWGDWLGTGQWRGGWRSFKDARAFVHRLNLKNVEEWSAYANSVQSPPDIPRAPQLLCRCQQGEVG